MQDIYQIHCMNDNGDNYHHVYNATAPHIPPRLQIAPPWYDACIFLDPGDEEDPTEGGNGWESLARETCALICQKTNVGLWDPMTQKELYPAHCDPALWTDVEPQFNSYKNSWYTCPKETHLLNYLLIESVLGSTVAEAVENLPCDLRDDCADYLDFDERSGLWTPSTVGVRYTADILLESDPGESSVALLGGTDHDLEGHAAYTAVPCGEDACPFYLAQLDLEAVSSIGVTVTYGSGAGLSKTISDLSIALDQPALGIWVPSSGDVIFPAGSLKMRVEGSISGPTDTYGENGPHSLKYAVPDYIFGAVDSGGFALAASGTEFLGAWSVNAEFMEE